MFVTVEGVDGAGKSTLIEGLALKLENQGREVLRTREPGSGPLGPAIRKLLLDADHVPQLTEVFLFLADRSQHIDQVVKPALENGKIVLCDRHADSTTVYQGYGRGLDIEWLRGENLKATEGLKPSLTLLLDLPADAALARQQERNRLGSLDLSFYERVRQGFLQEAGREPERWIVLDASASKDSLVEQAWRALEDRLQLRGE